MGKAVKIVFLIIIVWFIIYSILVKLGIVTPENSNDEQTTEQSDEVGKDTKLTLEDELKQLNEADGENLEIIKFDDLKVGDIVEFGKYEQDADRTNGKEPLEWIVLSVEDDRALLFSRYVIDGQIYNKGADIFCWEDSKLREWLNGSFYRIAFDQVEQNTIQRNIVKTPGNPMNGEQGSNDTIDKIFVLTVQDMINPDYGFSTDYEEMDDNRIGYATPRASMELYNRDEAPKEKEAVSYWLRSSGDIVEIPASVRHKSHNVSRASCVNKWGNLDSGALEVYPGGVRPALYIKLK